MKKSALALILAVLMAVGLLTIGAAADGTECEGGDSCDHVAAIGNMHYESLAEAVEAAGSNETTIELLKNANGDGVKVQSGSNITFDLKGFTYTIDGTTVGSPTTETNGFQLLRDSTITFKNGKITSTKAKILIQNYSDLTLDKVTLDGRDLVGDKPYTLSNNFGNVVISNSTITAKTGGVAFDVYYWPKNGYGDGVSVTVEGNSVITGKIEYGSDGTEANVAEKASLNITGGTFTGGLTVGNLGTVSEAGINVTGGKFEAADGGTWDIEEYIQPGMKQDENGNIVINEATAIATVDGSVGYTTLEAALAAAKDGQTVTLQIDYDATSEDTITLQSDKSVTLDLGGKTLEISRLNLVRGWLTVKNGEVDCDGQAFNVYAASTKQDELYTKLVIEKDVTIDAAYGICLFPGSGKAGYSSSIEVYGKIATGGIFVSGNLGNDDTTATAMAESDKIPTITIHKGAVVNASTESQGIAMNGLANVTVNGGTISGREAIGVKRGTLTVNGGTFTSTGEYTNPTEANHNGTEDTGATISITSTYNYAGTISVTLKGGSFTGENAPAVYVGHSVEEMSGDEVTSSNVYAEGIKLNIAGGTFSSPDNVSTVYVADKADGDADGYTKQVVFNGSFSSPVTAYLADNLKYQLQGSDGMFSYYETLDAALEAAAGDNGAVITGVGSEAAVQSYTVTIVYGNGTENFVQTLPADSYTLPTAPSKPGYIFLGWRCGDVTYGAGDAYDLNANKTFYAVWANMPDVTPGTPGGGDDEPVVTFPFNDVSVLDWFYDSVYYVWENELMNGTDVNQFSPNSPLTRAMVWAVLARVDGETISGDSWMTDAQAWAVESGVSDGTDPTGYVTREQLVTMLYRFAGEPAGAADISGYPDAASISDWAADAMAWAVKVGLIEGDDVGALNPTANSTRAHAATFFMRFSEL